MSATTHAGVLSTGCTKSGYYLLLLRGTMTMTRIRFAEAWPGDPALDPVCLCRCYDLLEVQSKTYVGLLTTMALEVPCVKGMKKSVFKQYVQGSSLKVRQMQNYVHQMLRITKSWHVFLFFLQLLLGLAGLVEPLEGGDRGSGVGVGVVLLQSHGDVVLQVELGLGVIGLGLEVDNQIVLDGEDGVDVEVRVVGGVDLVDDGGVVGVGDHQVNVGRTHGRAVHEVEENTGGTVGGERVRSGVVAVPPELALLVGAELAAKVVLGLVGVLEVVLAVGGGLPDVKNGTDDGSTSLHVLQNTVHEGDLSVGVGVLNDAVAELTEGSVGRPEGTENDVGGGGDTLLSDDLVGDLIDKAVGR